ncbi:uncharacterized protein Triagg1_9333 [Trichoderma aggressivum f. europaeum]|uniref:Uncharacterized protein n=1 Tax=Trichoderma aggressivum f. europaeum TaxID=173218 RepID=A0AAE1I784_9HYPO|nr:hypothetical protein Triagg1_9333 [Trichoderma aggressivum f. europaeum]
MSSRSGSGQNPQRPRDSLQDFPPLSPPSTLSSLRTLNSPRGRDGAAAPRSPPRFQWTPTAARRAERIRNLDERLASRAEDRERHPEYSGRYSLRRFPRSHAHATEGRSSNFEELDRSLDEANSNLRALLDLTHSALTHSSLTSLPQPLRSHDSPEDNRRSKRRKLDADRLGSGGVKAFRYGRYGQVEPGHLRMEIVSCDGGMFSNQSSYAAENILKDDNSVYCTKGNRCNIILQHQGATVFTLKELVIKAPCATNFSHPVREGMIFITMNQDDMLNRTAQYQIQYGPTSRQRSRAGEGDSALVLEREPRHIISIQHHDDGTTSTRTRTSYVYRPDDDDNHLPEMPEEFSREMSDFRVTTECSDEEDDDDDGFDGPRFHRTPNRIGSLPFESPDSDAEDIVMPFSPQDTSDDHLLHHTRRHNIIHRQRDRSHDRAPSFSLSEALDAHATATQEAVRAVGGGGLLAPHARFYIEKKKSKCTIKFDPPVSGRFILLKMWSSSQDPGSNIDVQSVITRGFAGPRYFPSAELR